MATQFKTRVREAPEAEGVISLRKAAQKYAKYGVARSTIQDWVKNREVVVAKAAAFTGDTVLLDEVSLRKRISVHTPHRDNAGRKRSRTIPQMQEEAQAVAQAEVLANGASNGQSPAASKAGGVSARPATPAPAAGRRTDEVVLLNTREWVGRFYSEQARSFGGELNYETKDSYDWTFDRFASRYPTLPMDRKTVLDYIHGLTNLQKGGPLSNGAKALAHRVLTTFYRWLGREYNYTTPDLTHVNLPRKRERALPIWPADIRSVLSVCREHSEKTIVLLLAQTAARIGELCTFRPEFLHDHWIEVWGKPTGANPTGYRQLPLPDAAYDHLVSEFGIHKKLVWVDNNSVAKPLAGPIEPAIPGRAIDMRDPDSYRVRPATTGVNKTAVKMLQTVLRRLMKDAGVYQLGMGAHSFRRGYQAQFVKNGGDREFYRLIMGHFQVSNMDDLYTHAPIEDIVEQARKYAPRSFLDEPSAQGELFDEADVDLDDDEDE